MKPQVNHKGERYVDTVNLKSESSTRTRLCLLAMADAAISQVMEVTGCSKEAASRAVEAAGQPPNLDLAVDFVLSTMSTHFSSAEDLGPPPPLPHKMVMLVRQDLGMGIGKVAAQVSHATLHAYKAATRRPDCAMALAAWEDAGEPTIVLKVADHEELQMLLQTADSKGLVTARIADAGRTEVAPGTVTVGAIGPAPVPSIDEITGRLSLLT